MPRPQVTTAATLGTLLLLLLVGALLGWRALTAPLPEDDTARATAPAESCDATIAAGDVITTGDVRVSVYNAGSRAGLAATVMQRLEARGFLPGRVRNAPGRLDDVRVVRVLAARPGDPAARLVARQFGRGTRIDVTNRDLGPGVEVIVGDDYVGVVDAPRRLTAKAAGSGC